MTWQRPAALIVLFAALFTGCNSEDLTVPDENHRTPAKTLQAMGEAVLAGDEEAYLDCFDANEAHTPLLQAMCMHTGELVDFLKNLREEYGPEATLSPGGQDIVEQYRAIASLEGVSVNMDGSTATATRKGTDEKLILRKVGQKWLIDAEQMLSGMSLAERDMAARKLLARSRIYDQVTPQLDPQRFTLDQVRSQVSEHMQNAVQLVVPSPLVTLRMMQQARVEGDLKAFLGCFLASPGQAKVLAAECMLAGSHVAMLRKMRDTYGADSILREDGTDPLAQITSDSWLADVRIDIDRGRAVARRSGGQTIHLRWHSGLWRIDASRQLAGKSEEDLSALADKLATQARAYQAVLKKVDEQTPMSEIRKELRSRQLSL